MAIGEVQGEALAGLCLATDQHTIRRREESR